jgi:hypothetical protein
MPIPVKDKLSTATGFFNAKPGGGNVIYPYHPSADQDQMKHSCCLIMVYTVPYLVDTYFEIFLKMMNGFVQIERQTSPF